MCALIYAVSGAQAGAQTQSTPAQGSIESALAIEDPNARIAALQKFLKTNNIPEQAQTAREAIVASWAQLADGQLGENSVERGMESFRRAIAALPERVTDRFFEETVIRIPFALSARGYRNEAVTLARLLEKRFAKEPPRLASLGEFYMTVEAADDAIHALETASKLAGEEAKLRRLLGAAYRMGLRLDDAVAEYQLAAGFDANDKRAYYELANLYRAHGAYADAIKLYRKQIEIEPKHLSSYKGLALAYLAQGDEEQMSAALNQARDLRGSVEEITGDIYLQTQMAFHHLARNRLSQARQAAEAALIVEPRYAWARIAAAEVDLASRKYFDAERNLLAARSYASFPTLYFTLGKLYLAAEDFDGAVEQFSKAFSYSPRTQFTAKLGGVFDAQADNLKELLAREHQAAIFLAEPPTTDETFKIAEALVRFNVHLRGIKSPASPISTTAAATRASRNDRGVGKVAAQNDAEVWRRQMEEVDKAAMDFIEAENARRSFRMLYVAGRLAQSGVAPGLVVELAEQALGLAEVATEADGSLREYPNYDRNGRLAIFRGRALSAKGWALFKAEKSQEAVAALSEAARAYGSLPEGRQTLWRLATVKETQGELKEALDLYIAGYDPPPSGSEIDVNRAVIESLYRKVHGSIEGLNRRLGLSDASSISSIGPSSNPSSGSSLSARTSSPAAKPGTPAKSDARNVAAKPEPKTGDSSSEKNPQFKLSVPPVFPNADRNGSPATSPERTKEARPAKTPPKPVELPTIKKLNFAIPLASSTDVSAILSTFESFAPHLALADEPAPSPPAPKIHTRKRRVTVPDNQQREL